MKIIRYNDTFLRDSSGRLLKVRPDTYIEPQPDVFMVEVSVEDNTTITLPTPNVTVSYTDTFLELYDSYQGTLIVSNDSGGTGGQGYISRALSANTEYFLRVTGGTGGYKFGYYNMSVTGNGTAVPSSTPGVTPIVVGTPLVNEYLTIQGEEWYVFKTTSASTYVMATQQAPGSAYIYNYTVDWGDGSSNSGVNTYNHVNATHLYTIKGVYVINITGQFPGFTVNNTSNMKLFITKCISWGNVGLRSVNFYGCSAMTTLPEQPGKLTRITSANTFCRGCSSLVSIPYGTFFGSNDILDFSYAFAGCTNLKSIHSTTFRDTKYVTTFAYLMQGCSKLLTLPGLLFENCVRVISWYQAFYLCSVLNNLPSNLFYRDTALNGPIAASTMEYTFANTGITSIPAGLFSSPQLDNLGTNFVKGLSFANVFQSCTALVTIPDYLFHNQTSSSSFMSALYNCTSLLILSEGIFDGCSAATAFGNNGSSVYGAMSGCTSLTEVKPYAFRDCTAAVDMGYLFQNCPKLVKLPANLFDSCVNITSFYYSFGSCVLLSSWDADPDPTKYQLDVDLFKYNVNVISFQYTFTNCLAIKTIPENLFKYNTKVSTFYGVFQSDINLTVIPPLLFRYNISVLSFGYAFYNCRIVKIPLINELGVDYGFFHFNTLANSFTATFHSNSLSNVGSDAIPVQTFANNTEAVTMDSVFHSCTVLSYIPDYLFQGLSKVTTFSYAFQSCSSITSIPANIFSGCSNVDLFINVFSNTNVTSIPLSLFADCVRVTNFSAAFFATKIVTANAGIFDSAGGSVQTFASVFSSCSLLETIEVDIFRLNVNVQSYASAFSACPKLVTVPGDLFKYSTSCGTFDSVFNSCTSLVDIAPLFFKFNTGASNFGNAFNNCTKLKPTIDMFYSSDQKATRFLGKAMVFTNCFTRSSYTGTIGEAPDLWTCTYSPNPSRVGCWSGAGNSVTSLSNYSAIVTAGWNV